MRQDNVGFIVFGISFVIVLVVAIRHNIFQDADDMLTSLKIGAHNIEYRLSPDRRMPLLLVDKEFGLRQIHPAFFNKLSKEEWQEFWDIIYGIHPLIEFENLRLPMADRNYSIAEIQKVLLKRFPEAFSEFSIEQWKLFWKEIKGIIGHKMQLTGEDEWLQKQRDRSNRRLDRKIKQDDGRISSTVQSVRETIGK